MGLVAIDVLRCAMAHRSMALGGGDGRAPTMALEVRRHTDKSMDDGVGVGTVVGRAKERRRKGGERRCDRSHSPLTALALGDGEGGC